MWQFISSRGKEYGLRQTWWIDERSDPEKATRAAARHLKDLHQEFGDWYLAMAAYNSGPVRVHRALERTGADNFWTLAEKKALPKETINYVPNILALTIIGKNPEKYGFNVTPEPPLETERVQVDKATDLRVIAEAINLPVEDLRGLNTHVLRWTTPPDDTDFQLILPKGYSDKFNEQISSRPVAGRRLIVSQQPVRTASSPSTNGKKVVHRVQEGETLDKIATTYKTSVDAILSLNKSEDLSVIHPGDRITIFLGDGN